MFSNLSSESITRKCKFVRISDSLKIFGFSNSKYLAISNNTCLVAVAVSAIIFVLGCNARNMRKLR